MKKLFSIEKKSIPNLFTSSFLLLFSNNPPKDVIRNLCVAKMEMKDEEDVDVK